MMNGEVPSVPITTLAGIASLTDLLPQLPLPTPLPNAVNNKSLLCNEQLTEDAQRLLSNPEEGLVDQLAFALGQCSTEHIELKDNAGGALEGDMPELLRAIIAKDSAIFNKAPGPDGRMVANNGQPLSPYPGNQMSQFSPYSQMNSPRVNQSPGHYPGPSSPCVRPPSHQFPQPNSSNQYQQQFQHFTHPQKPTATGAVNGDHFGMTDDVSSVAGRSRSVRTNRLLGPIMNSPAQASIAETISHPPVAQPSLEVNDHSKGSHNLDAVKQTADHSPTEIPIDGPSTSTQPAGRLRTDQHDSIAKLKDLAGMPKRAGQPVVLLEPLDPKIESAHRKEDLWGEVSSKREDSLAAKCKQPVILLKPLDQRTLESIASGGTVKTDHRRRDNDHRKGSKRRYGDGGYDDYPSSLSERVKKRKRHSSQRDANYSDDDDADMSDSSSRSGTPFEIIQRKKKEKRLKRMNRVEMSIEELLDSPTFKKFSQAMEYVFDSAEEINFGSLDPNDEEANCPPESLISRSVLSALCGEAAKLKSMGVFNQVPPEKLVKLLTIFQWNIRDGTKLLPNMNQDIEDEEEHKLWRELTMERVSRSMDAALTAIYIITAPKMPKQVFLEDVIERIIMFGKFQLQNTVYPEFDPVYRVDPKDKDGYHGSLKMKRARAGQVKHKSTISLYNRLSDLVGNLAELVEIQELTDTVILQISTLGVSPFFVENISELQLNAMKLVTTVFAHYDKHRQLILEDIFASLARLPSSKRNLRNYRLNADESIQMVTALALQLIQCVARLPQAPDPSTQEEDPDEQRKDKSKNKRRSGVIDPDVVIVSSYETAMRTGHNFLTVFLKKCTMKGEDDYRPLFENFVQDLLSTVNKPEWPASELLLSLLGRILVEQFSNKHVDMSLRTASLEYLGITAARLRKDAVSSQLSAEIIDDIVSKVNDEDSEEEEIRRTRNQENDATEKPDEESDETQDLQKAMLDYLAYNGLNEPAYLFARQFYIAQWFRDTMKEAKKNKREDEEFDEQEAERTTETLQNSDRRKKFLFSQVETNYKPFSSFKPSPSKLDYDSACLVARYLSSKRPFAQSFDIYLTQILKVLSENAVAVRTKAMKCLTAVVEADPGVLAREDMERAVHGRFLDPSTSVREAAVELVGKFILIRPELIPQYYNMLSERILDTGISVRKRVIKIFRDVFVEQPDFNKIPEMCVKMIRRVNDEEGIKKLVNDVFQSMWFTPLSSREKDSAKLIQRVVNITEVVAASKDTGYEFIEQLLDNLLKKDEHGNYNKSALTACRQIVDCLVENVLRLEERSVDGRGCSQRLIACLSTLFLFSKIKPDLMVQHATTLQPYLDIKCSSQGDYYVLHYVAQILELVVPLMDHPSETFLAQVEEDLIKLILNHGMMVLQSCVACLGAIVNNVSHNYSLVKDCFQKFFHVLSQFMTYQQENPDTRIEQKRKPTTLRALFTVGLFCKHFDLDSKQMGERKSSVKDRVFDVLVYFTSYPDDDVQLKALTGLGFLAVRYYEFMLGKTMQDLYFQLLGEQNLHDKLKCQTLKNLSVYLVEEEIKMSKSDAEWKKHAKEEDLRDMGDVQSGMASAIMQVYLKDVLQVFFHKKSEVRLEALSVIQLVLRQGLIHPVQCVPYLITMGTDSMAAIRVKADQQLQEIEKKYPGFIHMKALQGIKLCYRLQKILQKDNADGVIRGLRNPNSNSSSLNAFLYTVLRTNRSHRRAILTSLLNLFDDSGKISLDEQLYIADNLAFFTYQTQEEPLFIIHQIDILVSVSGSNLLQSFRERLNYPDNHRARKLPAVYADQNGVSEENAMLTYDDDEEDEDTLLQRLPANIAPLKDIILLAQGCILLLYIKQHLKDMYGFTDGKIQNYSPSESAKVYEKPLTKKTLVKFNPECVLNRMKRKPASTGYNYNEDDEEEDYEDETEYDARKKVVQDFLEFKDLMLSVDPPDEDDSEDGKSTGRQTPIVGKTPAEGEGAGDRPIQPQDQNGYEPKDVIEIDGEGDAQPVNPDKESPNSDISKPRIAPVIISTAKLQTPVREKEKKKSHQNRTLRLPGASQLQALAQTHVTPSSSHSSHHSSHSRSHHKSASSKKKKAKRRKRYASDYSDDDSDYDPDYC